MSKYVCSVCGYVHEAISPQGMSPVQGAASKFVEQGPEMSWAAEHVVGVAKGAPEEILQGLRENFQGECSEVGMYLAMSVWPTVRVSRDRPCIGRRQLWRRLSTPPSSPSCWARC